MLHPNAYIKRDFVPVDNRDNSFIRRFSQQGRTQKNRDANNLLKYWRFLGIEARLNQRTDP